MNTENAKQKEIIPRDKCFVCNGNRTVFYGEEEGPCPCNTTGLIRITVKGLPVDTTLPCWNPAVARIIEQFPGATVEPGELAGLTGPDADALLVELAASAMEQKLTTKRQAGISGWNNPFYLKTEPLLDQLKSHLDKDDPVDVLNLTAMVFVRQLFAGEVEA